MSTMLKVILEKRILDKLKNVISIIVSFFIISKNLSVLNKKELINIC